jgi:WD40 repeat protein
VRVWDLGTRREVFQERVPAAPDRGVALSPDGRHVAAASDDRTVKVWEVDTGREICALGGHAENLYDLTFSPDGQRLYTVTLGPGFGGASPRGAPAPQVTPGEVRAWEVLGGRELFTLRGHPRNINSWALSPDGRRLATAGGALDYSYHSARVWDALTGKELFTLHGTGAGVAFSPDGQYLATSDNDDQRVQFWDPASGRKLFDLEEQGGSLAFGRDGRRLAVFGFVYDKAVRVWELDKVRSYALATRPRPSPEALRAWREQQAQDCETAGHWFAAAFHLERLLAAAPDDAGLQARRSRCLRELGQKEP